MQYGKPLQRTREYIEIVRKIFARENALTHKSEHYQIPYAGPGATGPSGPMTVPSGSGAKGFGDPAGAGAAAETVNESLRAECTPFSASRVWRPARVSTRSANVAMPVESLATVS